IGIFINTLVMRNTVGEKNFKEFLKEVKGDSIKAFDNREYPFEALVEKLEVRRDVSRNPLFDVMFILQNVATPELEIPGIKLSPYKRHHKVSKFDLTLACTEAEDGINCAIEYSTELFKKETVAKFAGYLKAILSRVLDEPSLQIPGLEIIPPEERQKILYDFNDTFIDYPEDKCIHQLFRQQVKRTPGKTALISTAIETGTGTGNETLPDTAEKSYTYRQLNEKTAKLAHHLRTLGVRPGMLAGIHMERTLETVIGILAILKTGAAYLPIDPGYPEERKTYILRDSAVEYLLVRGETTLEEITLCTGINGINIGAEYYGSGEKEDLPVEPATPAYVIYTSGSTGRPKGVVVEHGSVVNLLSALYRRYPFKE
ncbi:MAG: AMP-binding protein, partial [bacterium]|nr:AMP-binding protein [bacterium]